MCAHYAVIVLTLNNTQEAVTFEEIREFEQLSEETQETQKSLTECAESGMLSYFAGERAKKEAPRRAKMRVEALDWLPFRLLKRTGWVGRCWREVVLGGDGEQVDTTDEISISSAVLIFQVYCLALIIVTLMSHK